MWDEFTKIELRYNSNQNPSISLNWKLLVEFIAIIESDFDILVEKIFTE